mmetsp:Transcript_56412/g.155843  ORF Transcript_56412/g.155843 Transcript_56412/m.155843 type:complete len:245 (-) Transcript_56412:772-1506(-)
MWRLLGFFVSTARRCAPPPLLPPVPHLDSCQAYTPHHLPGTCAPIQSSIGAIESQLLINGYGSFLHPTILSEQQIVDCAPNPDNCGGTGGCEGSIQPLAFEYLLGAGVETRVNYTYTGKDGTCADDKNGPAAATIDSYGLLPENCDEETLKQYVGRGTLTTHRPHRSPPIPTASPTKLTNPTTTNAPPITTYHCHLPGISSPKDLSALLSRPTAGPSIRAVSCAMRPAVLMLTMPCCSSGTVRK